MWNMVIININNKVFMESRGENRVKMSFQGKSGIQKKEGNLTREHKYIIKLATRNLQWRGMTH